MGMYEYPGIGQYYTPEFGPGTQANLKASFEDFLRAARSELLRQAGTAIAQTPEGKAAIEAEARRIATERARQAGVLAAPWLPLVAVGAILFLTRRR